MTSGLPGEDALILSLAQLLPAPHHTDIAIGDDAAVIPLPDGDCLLITTDSLMEGVHFRTHWGDSYALGWKALAQNLSDIAAMGGTPTHAVIAIALPAKWPDEKTREIYRGIAALAGVHDVDIIGGDTVRSSGPLTLTLTVLGRVARQDLLTRAGARAGDALFVTGTLGAAAAGLRLLERDAHTPKEFAAAVQAQLQPQPRLAAARALASAGCVTAMMDLSDGIATDLHRLCRRSRVGAMVNSAALPMAPLLPDICRWLTEHGDARDPVNLALTGGEDFELLFTAPVAVEAALRQRLAPLPLTRIGQMTEELDLLLFDGNEYAPLPWGFTHF